MLNKCFSVLTLLKHHVRVDLEQGSSSTTGASSKTDLFNCVLEFFKNGKILKEISDSFITLIPKVASPLQMHRFRPIILCSMVYKIISKILVSRPRPLLDQIISSFQSACILGRSIHDSILLMHEIMHKFKTSRNKIA